MSILIGHMGHISWMVTTILMVAIFKTFLLLSAGTRNASFDDNYSVTWGNNRVLFLNQKREVQLTLDKSSGVNFASKAFYGSGHFQMRIKVPRGDTAGVVTAFYLFLNTTVHNEVDFEFLGNRPGKHISLQTNIFVDNVGHREQKFHLWFDPTADFHYYKMLWNNHQIVFFVDDIPIRVHENNVNKGEVNLKMPMQVMVSLWDGSGWATDKGKTKANYSNAPFHAHFQDFNIDGCVSEPSNPNKDCDSGKYWWNTKKYTELNPRQVKAYRNVRKKYMKYDFCKDKNWKPLGPSPECDMGEN